ncbi:MAG TPA: hypothetical protein VIV14_05095 [Gammaproteobacteria bacterium]
MAGRTGLAQSGNQDFIPLGTSINALMVALVDHSAHEIWEAGAAETLTGRDWQAIEQHAIQLVASGTLVSLGGNGVADRGWVMAPAWQEWTQTMTEGALAALEAVQDHDQDALSDAGGMLVESCEGCHRDFKPDVPTEGIMHIPHYDD